MAWRGVLIVFGIALFIPLTLIALFMGRELANGRRVTVDPPGDGEITVEVESTLAPRSDGFNFSGSDSDQ